MINYNISLNEELAIIVEQEIKKGKYSNRSEFFREMIRKIFIVGKNEIDEKKHFNYLTRTLEEEIIKKYNNKTLPSAKQQLTEI